MVDLVVSANSNQASEITDYVLKNNFGFCDTSCGGEDQRVYIFKYRAKDVNYSPNIFIHALKSDLRAMTSKSSFKGTTA